MTNKGNNSINIRNDLAELVKRKAEVSVSCMNVYFTLVFSFQSLMYTLNI